jgi:hypothetical protein
MNLNYLEKMKIGMRNTRGVAIVMVVGLVAIITPVLFMLSQMGQSQIRLAQKYQKNLMTENIAFCGTNAGYSRLKGNLRGYQDLQDQILGENEYSLTLHPTGEGFFKQDLYYVMSKSKTDNHDYCLLAEAEQFHPNPDPPVLVLTRDYWNTVEPYETNVMADVLSMQNSRGLDLLRIDETREFEENLTDSQYRDEMLSKKTYLPEPLQKDWSAIVSRLVDDKVTKAEEL